MPLVRIALRAEVAKENWSFGNGIAQYAAASGP